MEFNWDKIKTLHDVFPLLFNNEFLSDIKFAFSDGIIIYAHTFILSLRSAEYYELFKGMIGIKQVIQIGNITSNKIFESFLKYLYTDEIVIDKHNMFDILKLSLKYKVKTLENRCHNTIKNNLNEDNSCKILEASVNENWEELRKSCEEFIANNYKKVLDNQSFLVNNEKILKIILDMDPVSDVNELSIFKSVLKWADHACELDGIEYNEQNRRQKLKNNLKLIRFSAMTFTEFHEAQTISPGLLNDSEALSIFMKIGENSSTVRDSRNIRKQIQSRIQPTLYNNTDEVNWYSNYHGTCYLKEITNTPSDLNENFFIEFSVSQKLCIKTVKLQLSRVHKNKYSIKYNLYENGINILEDVMTKDNNYDYKISNNVLIPSNRYRLQYIVGDVPNVNDFFRRLYKCDYPIKLDCTSKDVKFYIYKINSHIEEFKFQY